MARGSHTSARYPEGRRVAANERPSLEGLVETGELPLESLHPGDLDITRELADLCAIAKGAMVLDVACGTGESACFLAERYAARVVGLDLSRPMLDRAREKALARGLAVEFTRADLHKLPFRDATFDAAICECTLCLCDKESALAEMTRVVRRGGRVGMHDLCWTSQAPRALQDRLAELEGERPETLTGWEHLFRNTGLVKVTVLDRSDRFRRWMTSLRRKLGVVGTLALVWKILRRWNLRGLIGILRAERLLSNRHLGYCILIGCR